MADQQLIEFQLVDNIVGVASGELPEPFPATQAMPRRIKQMPAEIPLTDDFTLSTVKKCPPFVDALTCGYLIPAVADIQFSMKPDGLEFTAPRNVVEHHDPRQLAGTAFQRMVIVKFLNPWLVRTPPGYSCLFTQPLNRFEIPFQALSGVVETDTMYHEVHFPSICLLATGQSFTLKKGTPLVQVIPIRRDEWVSKAGKADDAQRAAWDTLGDRVGRYKANNWRRKSFT